MIQLNAIRDFSLNLFPILSSIFIAGFHVLYRNLAVIPTQFQGLPVIIFNLVKTMTGIEEYNSSVSQTAKFSIICFPEIHIIVSCDNVNFKQQRNRTILRVNASLDEFNLRCCLNNYFTRQNLL